MTTTKAVALKVVLVVCIGFGILVAYCSVIKSRIMSGLSNEVKFSTAASSWQTGRAEQMYLSDEFSRMVSGLFKKDRKWALAFSEPGHKCVISTGVNRININPKTGDVYVSFSVFPGRDLYLRSRFDEAQMLEFSSLWRHEIGGNAWLLDDKEETQ